MKKLFQQKSFQIAFYTILSVTLILSGILYLVFTSFRNTVEKEAYTQIENKAREYANWIKLEIENPLVSSRALADVAIAMKRNGNADRAVLSEIIKRMLENNPEYLSVWITFELNAFDGKDTLFKDTLMSNEVGRFEPCYYRKGSEIVASTTSEADALTADYFNIPKTTLKETIIEPYYYSYTEREDDKIFMTSTTVPIIFNGTFIGVAGIDISMNSLQLENNKIKLYNSGFGKLLSSKGNVVCHPQADQIGKISPEINGSNGKSISEAIKNGKTLSLQDISVKLKTISRKVFIPLKFGNCEDSWSYAVVVPENEITEQVSTSVRTAIVFSILGAIILIILIIVLLRPVTQLFKKITESLKVLATGESNVQLDFDTEKENEIGHIGKALNELQAGLRNKADFARQIGNGDLTADFKPLSEKDEMGIALLEMRNSLKKAEEEEQVRRTEDEQRNWATEGIAKFADILRKNNNDIDVLSFEIIKELVKYMKMNQGGLFVLNDDDKERPFLELKSCYAYNRQKYLNKTIEIGEGLVGACFQEGATIYLTEIPQNYLHITSGLGEATPNCVIIVPLKINDEIYGIIELASFENLEKYQIEFLEKVAESIASTLSSVKINIRTAFLLERSQQQAEEMRAQEEEMRQNMEELKATQEEMGRKNAEIQSIMEGINLALPYIEFDADEKIIGANEPFYHITGLKQTDMRGMSHRNIVSATYIETGKYAEMWAKLRMGISVTEEFEHRFPKGKMYADETFTPIKDRDGNLLKVMMFFMDLTEQMQLQADINSKLTQSKEMEEEMRQNLEELQATQEQMARLAKEQQEKDEAIKKNYEIELINMQNRLKKQQEESEKTLTNKLKEQEEELKTQAEELRQNLEELQATQEQLSKMMEDEKRMKEALNRKNQELEDFRESMMEEAKAQKEMLERELEQSRKELEATKEELKKLKGE